jgi:hypothetical protein
MKEAVAFWRLPSRFHPAWMKAETIRRRAAVGVMGVSEGAG